MCFLGGTYEIDEAKQDKRNGILIDNSTVTIVTNYIQLTIAFYPLYMMLLDVICFLYHPCFHTCISQSFKRSIILVAFLTAKNKR